MGMKIDANLSVQPLKHNISFSKRKYCENCTNDRSKDTVEFSNKKCTQNEGILNKLHTLLAAALLAGTASCTIGDNEPSDIDTSIFDNIPEYMFEDDTNEPDSTVIADSTSEEYDDFSDLDSLAAQYPIDDCDGMAKTIQQIDSAFNSMSKEEQDKFLEYLIDEVRAEKLAEQNKN